MTRPTVTVTAERLYAAMGPFQDGDEANGWPLLHWCDTVTQPAAEIEGYAADTDTQVGWQPMLDPALCPTRGLPFLAQWVGAVVPVGADDATARAIVTHSPGWARGTPASVIAAARLWLTGSQHVVLTERYGGDAYAVMVTVYTREVVDLTSLTAAVKAALPAGFASTINSLTGWTIAEMESETSTRNIAYVESHWATVTAFESQLP